MEPVAPRSRKREHTRERLMDAAYDLFAQDGVHSTSIEAIAEAAGFTRGAFYSNFASKDELFFALADREWSIRLDIARRVIEAFSEADPPPRLPLEQRVTEIVVEVFTAIPDDRNWGLIYREFELLAMREPGAAAQYLAHERAFRTELTDVLTRAKGALNVTFAVEPAEFTEILLLLHEAAMREALLTHAADVKGATRDQLLRTLPLLIHQFTRVP